MASDVDYLTCFYDQGGKVQTFGKEVTSFHFTKSSQFKKSGSYH
jgi:hypothetical protein